MLVLGLAACTSKPKMKETTAAPNPPAFDVAGMDTAECELFVSTLERVRNNLTNMESA